MFREAVVVLCILGAAFVAPVAGHAGHHCPPAVPPAVAGTVLSAAPADPSAATHLAVFMKGVNHVASDYLDEMAEVTARGAFALTPEYTDFDADTAAALATRATFDTLAANPSVKTVIVVGVSGGLPGVALALAAMPLKPDCSGPLFDYLIDVEGVASLVETYAEARAAFAAVPAAGEAVHEIEAECGSPADAVCLAFRSATLRTLPYAENGLKGVALVHAVNDGLVPYDQSVEFHAALTAVGIPAEFATVLRGTTVDEKDTQATEYVTGPAGLPDVDLAGHASEDDGANTIMVTSLAILYAALSDGYVIGSGTLSVVDRELGTLP